MFASKMIRFAVIIYLLFSGYIESPKDETTGLLVVDLTDSELSLLYICRYGSMHLKETGIQRSGKYMVDKVTNTDGIVQHNKKQQ